jgi:glc operon protein GlcG
MHSTLTLSLADAQHLINHVLASVAGTSKGVAIAVTDPHGELIAFARTDTCPLPSITIAINKAYTAARERKPSKDLGDASKSYGFPMTNFGELRYVTWGGGFPVWHEGRVIGAMGVSGLPEAEDMQLATNAIQSLVLG